MPGGISTDGAVHAKVLVRQEPSSQWWSIGDTNESISFNTNDLTAIKSISAQTLHLVQMLRNGIIQGGSGLKFGNITITDGDVHFALSLGTTVFQLQGVLVLEPPMLLVLLPHQVL